jgi:hypothetical protein
LEIDSPARRPTSRRCSTGPRSPALEIRIPRTLTRPLALPLLALALALTAGCGGDEGVGISVSRILLENASPQAVEDFYIRTCGVTEWGPDRLGATTVAPGESRAFAVTPGCYDIRAVQSNDAASTQLNIEIRRGDCYQLTIHEQGVLTRCLAPESGAASQGAPGTPVTTDYGRSG